MQIITESAEHHFLTSLETLKQDPENWMACIFAFSKMLDHEDLLSDRKTIIEKLNNDHKKSVGFFADVQDATQNVKEGMLYHFSDHDIIMLVKTESEDEKKNIDAICRSLTSGLKKDLYNFGTLTSDMKMYQKIADFKLITAKRMQAYRTLSDENKMNSIGLRRRRRDEPVIMVVEDDRFTASYASNILKSFDVVVCRKGEDAISAYIEHAPDIVFLDIHLPGLNGIQTLQGIMAADPKAYVIMLSVDAVKDNIDNANKIGAAGFLKKPVSKERILNTVRKSPYIENKKGILPVEMSN